VSLVALIVLAGCNSYTAPSSTTTTTTKSGITTRAFVSNAGFSSGNVPASALQIVNFKTDVLATQQITLAGNPQMMAVTSNHVTTMVFDAGVNQLSLVDNATEVATPAIQLPDIATSMVTLPNNTVGYVAMRNAPAAPIAGLVVAVDIVNNALGVAFAVPRARRMALSHNGNTLLVFSDGSNVISVINTTNNSFSIVNGGGILDQPVNAVFSADDSTAYILSCGPECGGTAASVTPLNVGAMTLGTPLLVPGGATVGFVNNSTLYVAGSCATCGGPPFGRLTVISTPALAITTSVGISDGYHDRIEMTGNNKLYIGATNAAFSNGSASTCTNATQGCLSMFNMSGNTAVISGPLGPVTGIAPISGRNVVYVCEGGELVIYDDTADVPQATQIDIVGQAWDVKQIDP
jgi:hypothetical protein